MSFRNGQIVEAKYLNGWFPVVVLQRKTIDGRVCYLVANDMEDDRQTHEDRRNTEWRLEKQLRRPARTENGD